MGRIGFDAVSADAEPELARKNAVGTDRGGFPFLEGGVVACFGEIFSAFRIKWLYLRDLYASASAGTQKRVLRWLLKNRHFLLPKSKSALRLKMRKRILP